MKLPGMTIETDDDGIARILLHLPAGVPAEDGFRLLRSVMPALESLDRKVRQNGNSQKPRYSDAEVS
jgi:hypothetical protein